MTRITQFSDDSLAALKRDHERLRYELLHLRTMLRAYMSTMPDAADRLVGGCLAENHPGRNSVFHIHLGVWTPASDSWTYEPTDTVHAIDWRYGVPYPTAGATGLFVARISTTHGKIYEVVALDCESPGDCGE